MRQNFPTESGATTRFGSRRRSPGTSTKRGQKEISARNGTRHGSGKRESVEREPGLGSWQGPPTPPQVCRLPCASSGSSSRAGRLESRQPRPRWMGRGPEEEAIRERYQGLQGLQPRPCEPNGGSSRSPQGSPMEASESALGTMKRKVDDTLFSCSPRLVCPCEQQ